MPGLTPHPCRTFFTLAASLLVLAGGLGAQSSLPATGDSEVARKRAAFEATVSAILDPLNRKYAAALRRMEKELAIAKDYEAAIALRDERLAVEAALSVTGGETANSQAAAPEVAAQTGGVSSAALTEIRFAGADAAARNGAEKLAGAVRLGAPGQAAEWKAANLPAGGYEVVVTYSCAAASGFQVKEHFFRLACEAPSTGGADAEKTETFGTLKVTSRADAITLTAESVAPDAPLLIHELKLVSNRG